MTVRANTTVHLPGNQSINVGDLYDDDHDWVREYPQFFDDIEARVVRPIEQATAAPGERRNTEPTTESAPADPAATDPESLTQPPDARPTTVVELLEWVGDDKDRAAEVLDSENVAAKPRKSLVEKLQHLVTEANTTE